MKQEIFNGCGTAIITPFTEDGINWLEFERLIEFQISEGVDAIIVCGTTGESSTMTYDEKKQIVNFAVKKANKRIPIIVGTGSNNTSSVIEFSKYSQDAGADGLLIVTPYYNKTTQQGLVRHYAKISSSVSLPIILYNVPSRTGLNISPETCFELSKIPNIVAIKEASGNISQVANIAALCGNNLKIYSGNDDQILPILSLGGIGVISVLSNIAPKFVHNIVLNYQKGNIKDATRAQLECIDLINNLFSEVNPIPIKAALNMLGYNVGIPRLPLVPISASLKLQLQESLEKFQNIII